MHMYNKHVEQVGVRLKKYAYVCHVAQVETTLQHCHNLMHTILKMQSAVIARTMGWNCSIVSVSHLSQSQLVGDTNTSLADGVCGRG